MLLGADHGSAAIVVAGAERQQLDVDGKWPNWRSLALRIKLPSQLCATGEGKTYCIPASR